MMMMNMMNMIIIMILIMIISQHIVNLGRCNKATDLWDAVSTSEPAPVVM